MLNWGKNNASWKLPFIYLNIFIWYLTYEKKHDMKMDCVTNWNLCISLLKCFFTYWGRTNYWRPYCSTNKSTCFWPSISWCLGCRFRGCCFTSGGSRRRRRLSIHNLKNIFSFILEIHYTQSKTIWGNFIGQFYYPKIIHFQLPVDCTLNKNTWYINHRPGIFGKKQVGWHLRVDDLCQNCPFFTGRPIKTRPIITVSGLFLFKY